MDALKWLWQYVRSNKPYLLLASLLIIISSSLTVVVPILGGKIVDLVIDQQKTRFLVPIILLMIGVTLVRTAVRYSYQLIFESVGQATIFKIRDALFDKLEILDFGYFNQVDTGDVMARMTGDLEAIRHFTCWVSYNVIESVLWFITALLVMSSINWQLTLLLLLISPLIAYFTFKMSSEAHPVFFKIRESFARLNSMVEENISGNRVITALAREEYEIQKFNAHNEDYKARNMASAKVSQRYLPLLDFLASLLTVITILFGGLSVISGKMSLGNLVAFNGFLWMLNQPMRMSGWLVNDYQRFVASTIKIRNMLGAKVAIESQNTDHWQKIIGEIEFKNVAFNYPDDPKMPVLKNLNFKIKPGQTIGIIGETGSGKSTLVSLMTRFYDVTQGEILVDGKNIKDWPVRQIRQQITMVMQDVFLFSDTIADNIGFGLDQYQVQDVVAAAQKADADSFIRQMSEGYQTVVGERGVGLSGGQKQRLSLARALIKVPAVLILDDTTSAVDMETETKIQNELKQVDQKQTTITIATRISSIRNADQILVMSHGQIVEHGQHEGLLAKKGLYYDTYKRQLGNIGLEAGESDGTK